MMKFIKTGGFFILGITLLIFIAIGITWLKASSSVPDYDGQVSSSKVSANIDLIRDEHGVVHIEAKNQADAYFALGVAHAQDRFWQMHLARMQVAGRLAEIYGELAINSDIRMRTMGYANKFEQSYEKLSNNEKKLLDAYVNGVNTHLSSENFVLPPEFTLTFTEPEAWQVKHTFYVMFSLWPTLAGNASAEIRYARLKNTLGKEVATTLARPFPSDGHVALKREDLLHKLGKQVFSEQPITGNKIVASLSPGKGHSNNWVISGEKTESGAAMLANDPHLGLTTPGIWYLARLSYNNRTIRGVTIPGLPGITIGRNNHISWGFTTVAADHEDVYIETLNPDNLEQYLTPQGWQNFQTRQEVFKVRFADDVTRDIKTSRHGPVLSAELLPEGAVKAGTVLAVSSTFHQKLDRSLTFALGMNNAKNLDDVENTVSFWSFPPHNLVAADNQGDIGYFMVGEIPMRGENHQSMGAFPVDGSVVDNDWLGLVPVNERPQVRNPVDGQIITANGKITPDDYKHTITSNWPDPGRAQRIEQQMAQVEKHNLTSFKQLQLDLGSSKTPSLIDILSTAKPTRALDKSAVELINNWDGVYSENAPQPAIYAAWTMALSDKIYEDELGELFETYRGRRHQLIRDAFAGKLADWCNDKRSNIVESCADWLVPSLTFAMDGLTKEYGNDIENWRWRDMLTIRHTHLGLGSIPIIGDILSRDVSKAGGPSSPDVTYWNAKALPRIEGVNHAASLRVIHDMAEQQASLFSISSGQAGHFNSAHYDDLQKIWADGKYIEIALTNDSVKKKHTYKIIAQ
jgi:penicillin amidase